MTILKYVGVICNKNKVNLFKENQTALHRELVDIGNMERKSSEV